MKKIVDSIKSRPINIVLMLTVTFLYLLNNNVIKIYSTGLWHKFFVCYFNDAICPLFFLAYCNFLLLTSRREITSLKVILIVITCSGFVWEFIGPFIKKSSVTDYMDLVCYVVGAIIYWSLLRLMRMFNGRNN